MERMQPEDLSYYCDFVMWKQYEERDNSDYNIKRKVDLAPDKLCSAPPDGIIRFIEKGKLIQQLKACVYCRAPLVSREIHRNLRGAITDSHRREDEHGLDARVCDKVIRVHVCESCKWWYIMSSKYYENWVYGTFEDYHTLYEGIIKKFSLVDSKTPTDVLRRHLTDHPHHIHAINPRSFERLVADIYRDFYDCEVKHVGATNDGGVDLIAVIADEPHLIQVKRRSSPKRAESVSVVRELIGTLALRDARVGVIVSSAPSFSKQSIEASLHPNLERHAISLKLVARDDLLEMMRIFPVCDPYEELQKRLSNVQKDRVGFDSA